MKDMITQAQILNFEKLAVRDIESGIGFWIEDYKPIDKIKVGPHGKGGKDAKSKAVKADNGIYSFRYGTTTHEDKNAFKEKYTCECGKLTGTVFDGCRCSFCDTVVEFKDDNINITGWFKMENGAKIIHPILYNSVVSIIGKKDLIEMLLLPKLNANGAIIPSDRPYMNIGLIEFRERFDEIINHYMEKKHKWNNKLDVYELIQEHRDKVFTSCLPVFSLLLRPVNIIGGVLEYNKINKEFTKLSSTISQINKIAFVDIEKIKLMRLLDIVQKTYHTIYKHCIEVMAKSKKALIRGQMLGAKFNYVARNVITPNNDKTRIDEVTMSYLGFLELHKPEIINIMTKTLGYSMTKAYNTWFEATLKFDDMIYEIMMSMIKNPLKPVKVLINRNPSKMIGPYYGNIVVNMS